MSAARIVEAVDVFKDCNLSLSAGVPLVPPDQLGLDGLEAETRLLLDMSQRDQIRPLPMTGRTTAKGSQSTCADAHDAAHDAYCIVLTVTFDKVEYYFISFAKKALAFFNISFSTRRVLTS